MDIGYDRLRLLHLDQMGRMAIPMLKIFTIFSIFYGYKLFNTPNSFFYFGPQELFILISIIYTRNRYWY
ncbi:hypothetical protein Ahy_A10g047749 [Arachis hypogaea]|uniref:Uncharacterized protein n=1 Tax=Arachis hypogaea TaxID=3818 RepID=A0A445B3G1_ARAHY|nr:hypothetical protein Ahy_A10g047749 [Arachis hypogaea]